jgi:hypothetical protein
MLLRGPRVREPYQVSWNRPRWCIPNAEETNLYQSPQVRTGIHAPSLGHGSPDWDDPRCGVQMKVRRPTEAGPPLSCMRTMGLRVGERSRRRFATPAQSL